MTARESGSRRCVWRMGDVHGEFPTLERLLERVAFTPGDRLFALGDLVDRGPQSADALAWLESGRITLSVRGNHEQMLLEKLDSAEREGRLPWTTPQWFVDEIPPADWPRWSEAIWKLPIAATVRIAAGPVGLVHAAPTRPALGENVHAHQGRPWRHHLARDEQHRPGAEGRTASGRGASPSGRHNPRPTCGAHRPRRRRRRHPGPPTCCTSTPGRDSAMDGSHWHESMSIPIETLTMTTVK